MFFVFFDLGTRNAFQNIFVIFQPNELFVVEQTLVVPELGNGLDPLFHQLLGLFRTNPINIGKEEQRVILLALQNSQSASLHKFFEFLNNRFANTFQTLNVISGINGSFNSQQTLNCFLVSASAHHFAFCHHNFIELF